jgi:hypothetical protein
MERSSRRALVPAALVALVFLHACSVKAQTRTPIPTSLPRIERSDLRYIGSFTAPAIWEEPNALTYGGQALGMGPDNTLYFGGHDHQQRLCQITIPPIGEQAELVGTCVALGDWGSSKNLGGTLLWNDRLIVSKFTYYDATEGATAGHAAGKPDRTEFSAPQRIGDINPGFTAGYMGIIPPEWRVLFGAPAVTGQCCISILSRTSGGPSLWAFDPDDVGKGGSEVPARPLVYYPYGNLLYHEASQNTFFNTATMMGGVAWVPGTRSVLFIGRQGKGEWSYTGGPNAPPYDLQVWAYDAVDLLNVKNRRKRPWQVKPYAIFDLPDQPSPGHATINYGGATFDPETKRIYVTERYGESPKVHVWEVTVPEGTPPPRRKPGLGR